MAQTDELGLQLPDRPTRRSDVSAGPLLAPAPSVPRQIAPFAVDVLLVGNATRTYVTLAESLRELGLTSRDSLDVEGLFSASASQLPQLVIVDDEAADIEALALVRRIGKSPRLGDIPAILLSTRSDVDARLEAFSAGVVDFIGPPMPAEELLARVLTHVRLRRAQLESEAHSRMLESFVLEQFNEITESQMATIIALARLAESRDDQTGGHLERVQQYCRLIAERLAEQPEFGIIDHTFIDNIECASALHDIGKVGISDAILLKPSGLTDAEFETMKAHTTLGAETLEAVSARYPNNDFIAMGIKIARWHHERWDGSGYPDGLAGEAIPLPARIMAVADVYDALTSRRSYKGRFTHVESCRVIAAQSGLHFDPDVVQAFLALADEFGQLAPG